jgi:hypothetical protein
MPVTAAAATAAASAEKTSTEDQQSYSQKTFVHIIDRLALSLVGLYIRLRNTNSSLMQTPQNGNLIVTLQ